MKINLPDAAGITASYSIQGEPLAATNPTTPFNRISFAAAHVVANPLGNGNPSTSTDIDWESTLAYRRYLLGLGHSIAEAMDTSQRGMGLGWPEALMLIRLSLADAGVKNSARISSGCGTDQLAAADVHSLDDVVRAYLEQLTAIQKLGGRIVMMASRALARIAKSPDDYVDVYSRVLREADQPVILHWLGEMFDPALKGYWGSGEFSQSMQPCLAVINANVAKIDGIKISLLDAQKEVEMRRLLPAPVKMYTGDDFNYPDLIAGDERGFSHALLGIFDAIAPVASAALEALAKGDLQTYRKLLDLTVPLSRMIFREPTQYYKTGIVFLAWLNGHQNHFVMVGGAQSMRPISYFADIFRLADQARLLRDPELAAMRMQQLLTIYGL